MYMSFEDEEKTPKFTANVTLKKEGNVFGTYGRF